MRIRRPIAGAVAVALLVGAGCAGVPATSVVVGAANSTTSSSTALPPGNVTSTTAAPPAVPTTSPAITTPAATTPTPTVAPPPTAPPTPVTPDGSWPSALEVLAAIPVADERGAGYDRELFGYPARIRGDCDTRAVVLQRDSLVPAQVDPFGCTVVEGEWWSPYDGLRTSDPAEIEIDHVVALKEAWDSGAWAWTPATRAAFANDLSDPRTLRAVSRTSNRDKGDRDPSNWLPRADDVCRYLADWVAIKARWQLTMDRSEAGRIRNLLGSRCPDQRIAPFAPPPVPIGAPAPAPAPGAAEPAPPTGEVFYPNCRAAREAGAAPIRVGEPGYRPGLDGDGDGVACE